MIATDEEHDVSGYVVTEADRKFAKDLGFVAPEVRALHVARFRTRAVAAAQKEPEPASPADALPVLDADLEAYRIAPGGEGPRAADWTDKPHRLVYDLARIAQAQREALKQVPGAAVRKLVEAWETQGAQQFRGDSPADQAARIQMTVYRALAGQLKAALRADGLASQKLPTREEIANALEVIYESPGSEGYFAEADYVLELLVRRPATDVVRPVVCTTANASAIDRRVVALMNANKATTGVYALRDAINAELRPAADEAEALSKSLSLCRDRVRITTERLERADERIADLESKLDAVTSDRDSLLRYRDALSEANKRLCTERDEAQIKQHELSEAVQDAERERDEARDELARRPELATIELREMANHFRDLYVDKTHCDIDAPDVFRCLRGAFRRLLGREAVHGDKVEMLAARPEPDAEGDAVDENGRGWRYWKQSCESFEDMHDEAATQRDQLRAELARLRDLMARTDPCEEYTLQLRRVADAVGCDVAIDEVDVCAISKLAELRAELEDANRRLRVYDASGIGDALDALEGIASVVGNNGQCAPHTVEDLDERIRDGIKREQDIRLKVEAELRAELDECRGRLELMTQDWQGRKADCDVLRVELEKTRAELQVKDDLLQGKEDALAELRAALADQETAQQAAASYVAEMATEMLGGNESALCAEAELTACRAEIEKTRAELEAATSDCYRVHDEGRETRTALRLLRAEHEAVTTELKATRSQMTAAAEGWAGRFDQWKLLHEQHEALRVVLDKHVSGMESEGALASALEYERGYEAACRVWGKRLRALLKPAPAEAEHTVGVAELDVSGPPVAVTSIDARPSQAVPGAAEAENADALRACRAELEKTRAELETLRAACALTEAAAGVLDRGGAAYHLETALRRIQAALAGAEPAQYHPNDLDDVDGDVSQLDEPGRTVPDEAREQHLQSLGFEASPGGYTVGDAIGLKRAPSAWQHISSDGDSHTFRHSSGAESTVEGFTTWQEAAMCLGSPVWPEVPPDGERLDEPAPAEAEGAPAPARPPPADHSFMPERLAALEQRERALLACLSMRGLPSYVPQSMHAADIRNFAERSLRGLEALDARKGGA